MFNQSKRRFLKSMAYGSALALGTTTALSSFALAGTQKTISSALPSCDIQLLPQQTVGTETLNLTNHTNRSVTLEQISPVGLEGVHKHLAVKINKLGKHAGQSIVTLAPGETLSFVVAAISKELSQGVDNQASNDAVPNVLAGQLKVSSDHAAFDGMIPVTVFDFQAV